MTSQTFNLDLIPQGVPPIIHVSQYDKGQTWEIHLYENGIVFPVPANTSAAIQGTKPDSTGFQFPAVITEGDNVVTFTLEQQMTVFSGDIDCELVLVNGDDQVATINFILSVEPTTLDDDTVISETQLPLIEQAAELGAVINNYATQIHADAETASTAATAATSAAESTAADAATATQAADDAAASQTAAATSASNAATSASNAATSETNAAASASAAATSASTAESAAQTAQAAMNGKLSTYTDDSTQWDTTPTANSTKPVTSGGVKAQFDSIGTQIADINEDIGDVNAEIADLHTEDSRLSSQISNLANPVDYTNSLIIDTNSTWTGKSLKKLGALCQLQTTMLFNIANTGSYSLGYVPADCKPIADVSEIFPVPNGGYATITIQASDGQILAYANQSLYQWSISIHMMYISVLSEQQ